MKLEMRTAEFENVIYELLGVANLLGILATNEMEQDNMPAAYGLKNLRNIVEQNAIKLQNFMEQQQPPR